MEKTVFSLCALVLVAIMSTPTPAQGGAPRKRLTARVTKVYDGTSFQLGGGLRSALIGVAASGSAEAHAYLKRLIENKTVRLEIDEKPVDAYGQTLYYVFLEEGGHVNVLMVLRGLGRALVKHPNVRYRKELIKAENLAKRYSRGLWGNKFHKGKFAE